MAAKKKSAKRAPRKTPRAEKEPARSYVINVFGARPHAIDGTPTPSFSQTVTSSRAAQRIMKKEASSIGQGAYGEVRLPDEGNKLYAQGEVLAPKTGKGKPKFTLDKEL